MTVGKDVRCVFFILNPTILSLHEPILPVTIHLILQCALSWCHQLHADRQFGIEKARVPLSDQLRQDATGFGHFSRQHIRQGRFYGALSIFDWKWIENFMYKNSECHLAPFFCWNWSIDWLIDLLVLLWLIVCWIDWSIDCLFVRLVDWLIDCYFLYELHILIFRTVMIQIPLFGRWPCGRWAVFGWTRLRSIFVTRCENASKTKIRTCEKPPRSAWPNCTTLTPPWRRIKASSTLWRTFFPIPTPWYVFMTGSPHNLEKIYRASLRFIFRDFSTSFPCPWRFSFISSSLYLL